MNKISFFIKKGLNIVQNKHSLLRLSAIIIGRSGLGRLLKIKLKIQGDKYIFNPTALCSLYWCDPLARMEDHEFFQNYLKENDHYLDIGSNIGVTVIPAAKFVGKKGKVMAFEPHPKICTYLKENIALNNITNVEVHNSAVGNQKGHIYFTSKVTDDMNQVSNSAENSIRVPIEILDEVVNDWKTIALIKLDVEGYEKFVIEGAAETLKKTDCIYFEVSDKNFITFGYQSSDIFKLLDQSGFKLFKRNGNRKEINAIDKNYKTTSDEYENIIGIKNTGDFQKRTNWKISV